MPSSAVAQQDPAPDARLPSEATDLLLMEPAPTDTFLEQYAATGRFQLGRPGHFEFSPDGRTLYYLRSGGRDVRQALYEFSVTTGKERRLLTAETLLAGAPEVVTADEQARRERMRTVGSGITTFGVSPDGVTLLVPLAGRLFLYDRKTGISRQIRSGAGPAVDPRFSADGRFVALVRGGNLHYLDVASGRETPLTLKSSESVSYGLPEFVAQEEMGRFEGFWWAPDRPLLLAQITDTSRIPPFHVLDPSHPERLPAAIPYPRAGGENAQVGLEVIPVQTGHPVLIDWDMVRYPYLARVRWPANAPPTLVVQNRLQTETLVLTADLLNGGTVVIHRETDDTWVNLDESMPVWLPDGGSFLWATERNGGWQLELHARDGAFVRSITPVELNYRKFLGLDAALGVAWVVAGPNPTEEHIYRVPLDPSRGAPVAWTRVAGLHGGVLSPDGRTLVHTADLADGTRRVTVERTDAPAPRRVIGEIASRAELPPFQPRPEFVAPFPGTACWSVLLRPPNFKPGSRYPVLLHVYGGPHNQMVRASALSYLLPQWLANQGYIVVSIDGRGTLARGRAWERAIHHDLIGAPLTDQVETLRLLATRYPELDLDRCGVFGWSFGGYFAAMAVLRHPDIFRAGIAGAPVVDWRDYDTYYTERYLGLPAGSGNAVYDTCSVLTHAADLERPLLVVHGTADDNVHFLHSLKLSEALFRAGRPFEFLPLVGFTHRVNEPRASRHLHARYLSFFQETLRPAH